MKSSLSKLRNQLATDPEYFRKVYNFTFDFARTEGQRSLGKYVSIVFWIMEFTCFTGIDMAQAFWGLLLPHGFNSGALTRRNLTDDVDMDGWQEKYNQWWADFLVQRKVKGISKDTWLMVSKDTIACRTILFNIFYYSFWILSGRRTPNF